MGQVDATGLNGGLDVVANMRQHGIGVSPENLAVWSAYLGGAEPTLRRTIDIMLSNGRAPDDTALRSLFARFCAPQWEDLTLPETSRRALQTVQDLMGLLASPTGTETAKTVVLQRLAADTHEILRQSNLLAARLEQTDDRIRQLEHFLKDARHEATTDALTGLANRRAFDAALRAMAGEAMNAEEDLAVLVIDIDHFKQVNDRYGHDTGDTVLCMVAGAMKTAVRGRDFLARHGGEEFGAILPATGWRGALAVAENVRAAVQQHRVDLGSTAKPLGVTVSIGVACYDFGEKLTDWVARADKALYRAKGAGRNRVVLDDPNIIQMPTPSAGYAPSLAAAG